MAKNPKVFISYSHDSPEHKQWVSELAARLRHKGWEWLPLIFENDQEYRTALVAYYMALNIHELASLIASGQQDRLKGNFSSNRPFSFDIPLTFMSEDQGIRQRGVSLLLRNPDGLTELWSSLNVTREQMENSWKDWISLYESWLWNVYGFGFYGEVDHQNIFGVL